MSGASGGGASGGAGGMSGASGGGASGGVGGTSGGAGGASGEDVQRTRRGHVSQTLVGSVTPAGQIVLQAEPAREGVALAAAVRKRIEAAFVQGRGHGVLQLGAAELSTRLPPVLSFWRALGRQLVAAVCAALDPSEPQQQVVPEPEAEMLATLAAAVPPMLGAELVSQQLLAEVWADTGAALWVEAGAHAAGVQGYLRACDPVWNVVGRVCFHLAENKRDPDYPFAFIATYAHKLSGARLSHLPLRRALSEYAGAQDKLLALLAPLQRAAEKSTFIRELIDEGDIYQPLSWTPGQAHRFLCEIALYEQCGLVVRMPDWWNPRRRPRPTVSVSIGNQAPSLLGMDALLDFDVQLSLNGEQLSEREVAALLASTQGLVFIKGQWLEVDQEQIGAVLAHWQAVEQRAQDEGIGFAEAMRMLAGAQLPGADPDETDGGEQPWSEVRCGAWLSAQFDKLRSRQVSAAIAAGAGLDAQLRHYQQSGVQWLWSLYGLRLGACLADDMGLGKTIQVIALLSLLKSGEGERSGEEEEAGAGEGTDLLVVPASLIDNWRAEMERFAPQLSVLIAHPSRIASAKLKSLGMDQVRRHDTVITTYGTITRVPWMKRYAWRCVVLDEAQAIKNPGAKQTRAIKTLRCHWRLALTGTPVENRLGDLWSIFDFLNPQLLGTAKQFNSFCKKLAAREQNAYAPLRKLVSPYILRRLKTDKNVITDLPDKTEMTAHCLLSKKQAVLYQQSVSEMARSVATAEGTQRRGLVLAFLMRFKQICNHPSQWLADHAYDADDSGKFARLRALCEPMAARQDKVLVFTQFREMTKPLFEFLGEVFGRRGLMLHGGTPVKRRQRLVEQFQSQPELPYLVMSLKAGGTGLNLTAASQVIHFDRWWNPAVENQATDRAYRIGQSKNVLVHKFVCKGTVEERIDKLIAEKQQLSDEILQGGAEVSLTEMNDDELMALVSLDLQSATAG